MDCPMCDTDLLVGGYVEITPLTVRCDAKCPDRDCGLVSVTVRRDTE